jgi:hypothetical protein
VVGIDPGASTGVGIIRWRDDAVLHWCTQNFFSVQDFLLNTFPHKHEVKVIVEVPAGFLYDRNTPETDRQPAAIRDRMMLNIGGVKRESELLVEALKRLGFTVHQFPPVREKKWTPEKFRLKAKSNRRASEHERDAVRLALHYKTKQ